nr:hypothetical protein [Massilia sp. Dwa41.01b]
MSQNLPRAAAASAASAAGCAKGMQVGERQVAEYEGHLVAVLALQLGQRRVGAGAIGALEVAILDQGHGRVPAAADVVVLCNRQTVAHALSNGWAGRPAIAAMMA